MQTINYKKQLKQKFLSLGLEMKERTGVNVPDRDTLYQAIEEIKENAKDTGTFLPFLHACNFLELTPYEQLLVCVLWYQSENGIGKLPLEKAITVMEPYRISGEDKILSTCFHYGDGMIYLSPLFLTYINDEIPMLPDGMEFIFEKQKNLYGNERLFQEASALVEAGGVDSHKLALVISGKTGSGRHFFMEQICAKANVPYILIKTGKKTYTKRELNELFLATLFYDCLPVVDVVGTEQTDLLQELSNIYAFIGIIKEDSKVFLEDIGYGIIEKQLEKPDKYLKLRMIDDCLKAMDCTDKLPAGVTREQIASKQLYTGEFLRYINNICLEVLMGNTDMRDYIYRSTSTHLDMLPATRTFEELKLPQTQYNQLKKICSMIAAKEDVLKQWGFDKKFSYGNGMSLLFYGSPGTGKTMTAQVMANELGMPLYRVDLSQLISKYIGETQKNIGKIFEEADKCDCILLFDEADALFAKRSDVSDAQDRYSNAETAYLLQRIEQYAGVSILATNLLQNFDDAFRRRISYMVHFPLPDEKLRKEMWETIYPTEAMVSEDMDYLSLSQAFELSGAAIKNAALHGAYLAMAEEAPISMKHVLEGISNECSKIGKSLNQGQMELIKAYS